MKKILALLAMMCVGTANAGDVTFEWQHTTGRTDGTQLQAGELAGYRLYTMEATGTTFVASSPPTANSIKVTGVTGTKVFVIRAIDSNGIESLDSNPVRVSFSAPNAPMAVKVILVAP